MDINEKNTALRVIELAHARNHTNKVESAEDCPCAIGITYRMVSALVPVPTKPGYLHG